MRNEVMLQDLVSISDVCQCTCHMQGRLVARSHNASFDVCLYTCVHQHLSGVNEAHLRTKQCSTWHVSTLPSAGITADDPLRDVGSKCYVALVL